MQTGIIGLPQVGKTTLFRILTKAHVDASKGGQGTHVGVAKVPEPRLVELAKLYNPKKITYATVQYVDVGGMQKERNRDALAPLREVDTIAHVIRVFDDPSVPHAAGSIDPLRDATNLELELILSDHDQITRRLERVDKDLKKKSEPLLLLEKNVLEKCKAHLEAEKPLRELELTSDERKPIGGFLFLSARPVLYVLNVGDDEADKLDTSVERHNLGALAGKANSAVVAICGRLEAELAEMDEKEAAELLASYGLKEPGLNRLIRATYELMGLTSFFTAGEPEVRAWTIRKGATAVKAAGAIHSDIEKGFIRAEVVRWNDLLAAGSVAAAREKAQLGLMAAAGNLIGGYFVVRKDWSRKYLQYFLALGAGYMLAVAFVEVIPESVRISGEQALLYVLIGFFLVHLFEHTIAPHFHFGEETHGEEMRHHRARNTVLLGLGIHTFFDGVAIAAGFLVSTWLGVVIVVAVFLHKLPEGFTVASVVLASGMGKRNAILAAGLLGVATLLGVLLTSALQGQLRYALPLSGGVTLYVAATDLLPEVNREPNWRLALLVFVGVVSLLIMEHLFHV